MAEQKKWQKAALKLYEKEFSRLRSRILANEVVTEKITPQQFEHLIGELYTSLGYEVEVTKYSGDGGIDIWISKGKDKGGIQCKRYLGCSKIGRPAVQALAGALQARGAKFGKIITTGRFTKTAVTEISDLSGIMPIEAVDGELLSQLLSPQIPDGTAYEVMCGECGSIKTRWLGYEDRKIRIYCSNKHQLKHLIFPEDLRVSKRRE